MITLNFSLYLSFGLILFSLFYFHIGLKVAIKNWKHLPNRLFFSLCLNMSVWSFGYAIMVASPNLHTANLWRNVAALGWCLFYSTWLEFTILIKQEDNKWMTDIRRILIYLPSLFFFVGNLLYDPESVMKKIYGTWIDIYPASLFESLFTMYFVAFTILGLMNIYKWGRNTASIREKKQSRIIIISALICFIIGTITDVILPMTGKDPFPSAIVTNSIALIGILYAISKYKLMAFDPSDINKYLFNTMNDPVIVLGNDETIIKTNVAACNISGYLEEELREIHINSIVEDEKRFRAVLKGVEFSEPVKNVEVGLLTKNKIRVPCLFSGARIFNDYEESLGIVCIFHDITDRKNTENLVKEAYFELEEKVIERTAELELTNKMLKDGLALQLKAEESLKLSEEKFRALMKQSSDGILILDIETHRILESNEEASNILGVGKSELNYMYIEDVLHMGRGRIGSVIEELTGGRQKIINHEIMLKEKENLLRTIEITATLVFFGNKQYVVAKLIDITEKIKMEERKQQGAKMQSLGTLAGGIAHDFNNILAGIIGYTQLSLEDEGQGSLNSENLLEILKLGERAKKLIFQILAFSRKTLIEPDFIDLKIIIEDVLNMLKATAPINIEFKSKFQGGTAIVFADQGEMQQLIMNICVNAEQAISKNKGTLEVDLTKECYKEDRVFSFNTLKAGKYIKITIADNGCGIEKSITDRIFEPFYTTKGTTGGTGLGLSVVHGIIKRCGGAIEVDSELDKGTTFTIFLPAFKETPKTKHIPLIAEIRSRARILLVDDEETILKTTKKLLRLKGYNVTTVIEPTEALKEFSENRDFYDVIITDETMPVMTGTLLSEKIHGINSEVPIILCTGYNIDLSAEKIQATGIVEILSKPITITEYVNAIEHAMDTKKHSLL